MISRAILISLSTLIGLCHYFIEPIVFEADGLGYVNVARRIIGDDVRWDYFRTLGYPIIILLFSFLKSFKILIIVQTICAIITPLMLFEIFKNYNKKIAFFSSFCLIILQIPYTYCSYIFTETFYLFFITLGIHLFGKFLNSRNEKLIGFSIIIFFCCFLIKPIAQFVGLLAAIILMIFFSKNIFLKAAKVYLSLFILFSLLMSWFFNPAMDWGGGESFRQPHKNLFAKAYLTGTPQINWNAISTRANHDIFRSTAESIANAAAVNGIDPSTYKMVTKHGNSLDSITLELQNNPLLPYYNLIVDSNRSSKLWPFLFLAFKENPIFFLKILVNSCIYSSPAKGKFLFQNEFATSAFYGGLNMWWIKNPFLIEPKILKENGENSFLLFSGLNDFLYFYPQCWVPLSHDFYGRFKEDPKQLVEFAFNTRLYPYFTLFQGGLDFIYGASASDQIFLNSVIELWTKYPLTMLRIPVHFYFLISGISIHGGNGFINPTTDISIFSISHTDQLPKNLKHEVEKSVEKFDKFGLTKFYSGFKTNLSYFSLCFLLPLKFIFLISLLLMVSKNYRDPFFWLIICILANETFLISLFNFPNTRYSQVINTLTIYSFCFLFKSK